MPVPVYVKYYFASILCGVTILIVFVFSPAFEGAKKDVLNQILYRRQEPKIKEIKELTDVEEFYDYVENVTFICNHLVRFGGIMMGRSTKFLDGDKMVCLDEQFQISSKSCTFYSFGINNEWSFDDAIADFGCTVYAFDPSMSVGDHKRGEKIYFYNLGLGGSNYEKKVGNKIWKMKSLGEIISFLNHSNTVIDYLKMDIEGAEKEFFEDVLNKTPEILEQVKQIGMEIHPGNYGPKSAVVFQKFFNSFQKLEYMGFRLMYSARNQLPGASYKRNGRLVCHYYELVWGKVATNS